MKHTDLGRLVWHDLVTTDAEGAKRFYGQVADWKSLPGPGSPSYSLWARDETPLGGVLQLGEEDCKDARPFWMGHVAVEDVDATAEQAVRLGGSVQRPAMDIPNVGRSAVLADPQGASFPIFAGSGQEAHIPGQGRGFFNWYELRAKDWQAVLGFYTELFGWKRMDSIDMGEGRLYGMLSIDGKTPIGGMRELVAAEGERPHFFYYLEVEDVGAAADRVREAGGVVDQGPMPIPGGGRMVHARDPQGAIFGLFGD